MSYKIILRNKILFSGLSILLSSTSHAIHMEDFDARVHEWARNTAARHKTSVVWVSTNGEHQHLRADPNYASRRIIMSHLDTSQKVINLKPSSQTIFRVDPAVNPTNKPKIVEYSTKWKRGKTYTEQVTEGLKYGGEVNVGLNLGKIFNASISANISKSIENGKVTAKNGEEEQVFKTTFTIPPKEKHRIGVTIDKAAFEAYVIKRTKITGSAAVWFKKKIDINGGRDNHYLWFPSPARIVNDLNSFYPVPSPHRYLWRYVTSGNEAIVTSKVRVKGGTQIRIREKHKKIK